MELWKLLQEELRKFYKKKRQHGSACNAYFRLFMLIGLTPADLRASLSAGWRVIDVFKEVLDAVVAEHKHDPQQLQTFLFGLCARDRTFALSSIPDPPELAPDPKYLQKNWRFETELWTKRCPKAWQWVQDRAAEFLRINQRFGINLIREELRWYALYNRDHAIAERYSDEFAFCNNLSPYMARLLIELNPNYASLIECRETRW